MATGPLASTGVSHAGTARSALSGYSGTALVRHTLPARRCATYLQAQAGNPGAGVQGPTEPPTSQTAGSSALSTALPSSELQAAEAVQLDPANAAALSQSLAGRGKGNYAQVSRNLSGATVNGTQDADRDSIGGLATVDSSAASSIHGAAGLQEAPVSLDPEQRTTRRKRTASTSAAAAPGRPEGASKDSDPAGAGSSGNGEAAVAAAAAATSAADADAAASASVAQSRAPDPAPRRRSRQRASATADTAAASGAAASAAGGGAGDDDRYADVRRAARSRLAEIKASLLETMRAQTRKPSAASVSLMLTPLQKDPAPSDGAGRALRSQPLPPEAIPTPVAKTLRPRTRRSKASGEAGAAADEEQGDAGTGAEAKRAGRVLKPLRARRAETEAQQGREAGESTRARQATLRRANEEYADFLEGMAASVGSGDDQVTEPGQKQVEQLRQRQRQLDMQSWVQAEEQRREQEREAEERRRLQQQWEEERRLQEQRAEERRRQQEEQANVLRSLASMFRAFAQRAQPTAAAAAVVAAVSPATAAYAAPAAAAAAAAPASGADASNGMRLPLGLPSRPASDVKLILKPLDPDRMAASKDAARGMDAAAAAAGEGLRTRPLPTRTELLRLMQPLPRARLPTFTGRIGLRMFAFPRKMRSVRISTAAAEAAGIDVNAPPMPPAAFRALRRRAYHYRILKPRQAAAAKAEEAAAAADAAAKGSLGEAQATAAADYEGASVEEEAKAPSIRPRFDIAGRAFKTRQRLQYSDRVKRVVRRSRLAAIGGGAAAAAVPYDGRAHDGAGPTAAGCGRGATEAGAEEEEEEDPRGEYNPAAEVVNDAYEQIMGVRLPERAMYGRRAEALAALTPQDVLDKARAWIQVCGQENAMLFLEREPLLLLQPPNALLLSLEAISSIFELEPPDAVRAALRAPAWVGLPAEQLRGAVAAVSEALEVGMQEAGRIALRCPLLVLREPTSPVSQRVALLGALLPVSRDKLRQVLRQRPQLLTKSPKSLAAFMMTASSALGLPLFDVSLMIAGAPGVAGVNAARLAGRWEALRAAAAQHPAWREQLGAISPPSLGRCLSASDAAIARLQTLLERGLADQEEFFKFKNVLTMSAGRFEALLARGRTTQRRREPRANAVQAAAAAEPAAVTSMADVAAAAVKPLEPAAQEAAVGKEQELGSPAREEPVVVEAAAVAP